MSIVQGAVGTNMKARRSMLIYAVKTTFKVSENKTLIKVCFERIFKGDVRTKTKIIKAHHPSLIKCVANGFKVHANYSIQKPGLASSCPKNK